MSKRKTITFNVSEEFYAEIQQRFPDAIGTQDNLKVLFYAESKISDLESELSERISTISSLESKVTELESAISDFESQVSPNESRISELESELSGRENALKDVAEKAIAFKEEIDTLQARITELESNPTVREVAVEKPLPVGAIVLDCEPMEKHLVEVCARYIKCTPKQMLVNNFFMTLQERGPGDYAVPRLSSSYIQRAKENFENQ